MPPSRKFGTFGPRVFVALPPKCGQEVGTLGHTSVLGGFNLLAALVNLGGTGRYIVWGAVQISLANLIVILVMIVMFIAAIVLPFPRHETKRK